MPELPEVETVARTLLPHIRNHIITDSRLLLPASLHPLSLPLHTLYGRRITNTSRRGKLLLLHLDDTPARNLPTVVVTHLRMTGRLLALPATEEPHKHTRLFFDLQDASSRCRLFFDDIRTFGKVMAANAHTLEGWEFWRTLGPEPLLLTPEELGPRLRTSRRLKTVLLDQKVIAGIGNIYADESLFLAGLSPLRKANSLSEEEIARLLASIQSVLKLSISQCGSSIRDYRDADGNAGAFQNSFLVYGNGGQSCHNCGAPLIRIQLGGRATVYCTNCQV